MDKANIIISVIIVLCIAAAVAAYGITNSDNPIFSDLSSMSSNNNGNGIGNNSTNMTNSSGSVAVTNGGSGSGSGGASSSGSGSGSGYSGSSYSNDASNSGTQYSQQQQSSSSQQQQSSSSSTHLSYSSAQSIANGAVGEPGCYAGSVSYSGGVWYATIYDENGNAVDSITIDDATGSVGRG